MQRRKANSTGNRRHRPSSPSPRDIGMPKDRTFTANVTTGATEKTAKHLPQMDAHFEEEIGREIRAETHELQKPTTKNGGTEKTGAHRIK